MRKMLIAINSELLTDLLTDAFSQYDIHICHTGREALAQLQLLRPNILLLDLMLPDMDGITVLQKSSYKPPTILALTNLATPSVLTAAANAGIQGVILIPCTVAHILQHLDALLEKAPSAEG